MKKSITIIVMLFVLSSYSQIEGNTYRFSVQQDPKLAILGHSKMDKSMTLNTMLRLTAVAHKIGDSNLFPILTATFEYADLNQTFQRYSFGTGLEGSLIYNFWFIKRIDVGGLVDLGIISRGTNYTRETKPLYAYFSISFQAYTNIMITDNFGITLTSQLTERKDYYFYNPANITSGKWIYSNFAGVVFIF